MSRKTTPEQIALWREIIDRKKAADPAAQATWMAYRHAAIDAFESLLADVQFLESELAKSPVGRT